MTQTLTPEGQPIFFPPSLRADAAGVIMVPEQGELSQIVESVAPDALLLFAKRLIHSAKDRRRQPRWRAVNRRRLELARLCIDRILAEHLAEPSS